MKKRRNRKGKMKKKALGDSRARLLFRLRHVKTVVGSRNKQERSGMMHGQEPQALEKALSLPLSSPGVSFALTGHVSVCHMSEHFTVALYKVSQRDRQTTPSSPFNFLVTTLSSSFLGPNASGCSWNKGVK